MTRFCPCKRQVDIAKCPATLALLFLKPSPWPIPKPPPNAPPNPKAVLRNRRALTSVKNQLKKFRGVVSGSDKAAAKAAAQEFISTIDKAAKTGRVHRNTANRQKSAVHKALVKQA